jgi:hypothetical protein
MGNLNTIYRAEAALEPEVTPPIQRVATSAFRSALTSEIERAVKAAVTPLETCVQRAEKNIDDKFALLQAEFEKASRKTL